MCLALVLQCTSIMLRIGRPTMMVADTSRIAVPGRPGAEDEAQFVTDPRGFCAGRCSASGPVFATGAFGNAVFVGSAGVVDAISDASEPISCGPQQLREPFGSVTAKASDGKAAFAGMCDSFNAECYTAFFQWVPLFKESGGFSTFRFDDFLDPRVRKALPGLRRVIFRGVAPALLGCRLEELPASPGLESPKEWGTAYAEYASEKMKPVSGGISLPFKLPTIGGSPASLEVALGSEKVAELLVAVEPTAALVTSMLLMAQSHPELNSRLATEHKEVLSGVKPEAAIDSKILGAMPMLNAFALETLRMHPPLRADRLKLTRAVEVEGVALPAGSIVAPEPFIGHFLSSVYADPAAFRPDRFIGAAAAPAPSLGLPGAAGARGAAARELTLLLAMTTYVQMRRMHEVKLPVDLPKVSGYPLHAIPETTELKALPFMYYELQRGVRKLKF
jgi:hypothetical protein